MFMNEVCKKCALTKKAVEYYIEQGLVSPVVQENGYRDFADADVEQLKKISVLRGLGLSVADIRLVLSGQAASLNEISGQKLLEINFLQEKQRLMQDLAKTQDWDAVQGKLQQLQKKQSVMECLRSAFPGYYGNCICQHFAPYLNEPVRTEEQQKAYDMIIAFLDDVHMEIPDDLRDYYSEVTGDFDDAACERLVSGVKGAIYDVETFVDANRGAIEAYMAFTQTEDYKKSQVYRLSETLKQFNCASGYNDIFIPAMCRLSKTYKEYNTALQEANEKFLQMYPEWGRTRHE